MMMKSKLIRHTICVLVANACGLFAAASLWAQRPPAPVIVAPVIEQEIAAGQAFVATVRPTRTAQIGSAASGRVSECFWDEGDRVESMQSLAQLLTETISSEIEAAEAELQLRESMLKELENGTRPEEIEQAKARMQAAEARREFTKVRRERYDELFRQGSATSLDEREQAITLQIEAENNYLDAKAAHDLAVMGPRPEKILQAKAQLAMQQAIVTKLIDQKRKHTIISRFDGYVVKKLTEVGAWVNTGDLLFEVAALDEVDVEAFVTEAHVPFIKLGMEISVEIPALENRIFTGKVSQIVPLADMRTRTFPIRIRVTNEIIDGIPLIKAGMVARVNLPIGARQVAKLVPKDALVIGGTQRVVYVIDPDKNDSTKGTARPVTVLTGVTSGSLMQVIGELEPQQLVVIEGNERLAPGQAVLIAEVRASETQSTESQAEAIAEQ
jgi:RND family efflux transporter MFP subunit